MKVIEAANRSKFILIIFLVSIFFLNGCATAPISYKPVTIDRETDKSMNDKYALNEQDRENPDETLKGLSYERKAAPSRSVEKPPLDLKQLKTVEGPVTINVNRMLLPEFVIYVLGETMKIPFVMDQGVMNDKRVVTLQTPQPLPADKAMEIIIGVLEKHDLYLEQRSGALYVMQKQPIPRETTDVRLGRDITGGGDILQVIPLRHIHAAEIEPLIKEATKGGIQIKPYDRENVLILHGNSLQIRQIIDFIDIFDVPSLQAKKLLLLRLTYWQADDFITQLTKMLEGMGFTVAKSPKDPGPLFVPIRQMNGILVVAPDEATAQYILDWKQKMDTVEAAGADEKAYTFTPQYSRASDLVGSVMKLYGMSAQSDTGTAGKEPSRHPSSPSGAQTSFSAPESQTTGMQTQQSFGNASLQPASGSSFQAAVLPNMKIAADNNKNVVIMICSPAVYRTLLGLLRQIDTQTKQVMIEATIAELTLTDELKYGFEWYINNTINGGPITGGTLGNLGLNTAGTLGMAFNYVTSTGNFMAMLNAFANSNKANILSTPRLTVLDNHEAVIQIGEDVPIATGQQTTASSTVANPTLLSTIEYRSVGIILRVKPTINTEGLLTLELTQEVSDVSTTTGVGGSPIITMRRISTSVVAAHGQTVALGGLMSVNKGNVETKVPLLGDIPFVGNFFKTTDNTTNKTELLVLVTPTILTNTDDTTKITEALKKELQWIKF